MAQYIKKKKGWAVRFYTDEFDELGEQKRVYLSGYRLKEDAKQAMEDYLEKCEETKEIVNKEMTLKEYCEYWFDSYVIQNNAPRTQKRYSEMIINYIIPELGENTLIDLKPMQLQKFYSNLMISKDEGGPGLSGNTVVKYHRLLHLMYKHAILWQLAKFNPTEAVQPPKQKKTEMNFLNEKELSEVLDKIKGHDFYIPVLLAATTGMRLGEICGLQKSDVDLNTCMIYIKNNLQYYNKTWNLTTTKTYRSSRAIFILEDTIPILQNYIKKVRTNKLKYGPLYNDNNFFCKREKGEFINPQQLSRYFRRITRSLGYDVRFHDLRHTHASFLL